MADKGGLEGVVVARSRLCSIDGQNGVLVYGGYDVGDLAEHSSYEEVCFLTLYGELPTKEQFDSFLANLSEHRELSDETARSSTCSRPRRADGDAADCGFVGHVRRSRQGLERPRRQLAARPPG